MGVAVAGRYRFDDVRRFAAALAAGVGLPPERAATLVAHLLWFDAAGATSAGIAQLPDWLERIEARVVDPGAEGKVRNETAGTVVLDAQNGVPPLLLARAGELALEKARAAGVGLVRLIHLASPGPTAPIVADLAIGPFVGLAVGPGPSWSLALPSTAGLPAVFDPVFTKKESRPSKTALPALVAPWASAMAPEGGCLVGAIAVNALEPLATFQEQVSASLPAHESDAGLLAPATWEARRREAREQGVAVAPAVWDRLNDWAQRFSVVPPAPR